MGKQSTGKSLKLNHLFGTKFDVSGIRCTDGVCMTTMSINGRLFILLDFEGLTSLERSYQEDALQSVLNASISQCTIFKCENQFNTDVKRMFDRFENGINYLSGDDDRLFQGRLLIVVKDIPDADAPFLKTTTFPELVEVYSDGKNINESKIQRLWLN